MIRYEKLSPTENAYPFIDAEVAADYVNGTFGSISNGVFTAGTGFCAIMQVEMGDDAYTEDYTIKDGERARVADLSKSNGAVLNITKAQLPSTYAVGGKLQAASTGKLAVQASPTGSYIEIIETTDYGVRAKVVVA